MHKGTVMWLLAGHAMAMFVYLLFTNMVTTAQVGEEEADEGTFNNTLQ